MKMTYIEEAVQVLKLAGQELIDRAEELIPKTESINNIDVLIRIPSKTDDPYVVPEITVNTKVYPKRVTLEKIYNLNEQ